MHITFDESNVLFEGKSSSANPSTQVKDLAADLEKIDLTDPPQVVTTNIPLQLSQESGEEVLADEAEDSEKLEAETTIPTPETQVEETMDINNSVHPDREDLVVLQLQKLKLNPDHFEI